MKVILETDDYSAEYVEDDAEAFFRLNSDRKCYGSFR
jgi:hypothetical protein